MGGCGLRLRKPDSIESCPLKSICCAGGAAQCQMLKKNSDWLKLVRLFITSNTSNAQFEIDLLHMHNAS